MNLYLKINTVILNKSKIFKIQAIIYLDLNDNHINSK